MLEISKGILIPENELHFTFVRSSGPGGQNVNKVNTKAVLRWAVLKNASLPEAIKLRFIAKYKNHMNNDGELVLTSDQYRQQKQNSQRCIEKLCSMLLLVVYPPKKRHKTKPSQSSVIKRLNKKRAHAQKKKHRRLRPGNELD